MFMGFLRVRSWSFREALVEFAMARDVQCLARGDGDRRVAGPKR